jgi:hypothetical protein
MPFSKSVLFSRLVSLLTCNISARRIRLVCLVSFFAIALSSLPVHLKHDSATAQGSRPQRTQGPPSRNLPNLDEARGFEPGTPKIMPTVPATRCRGRDERCKRVKGEISSNLTDNQDQLSAYASQRSGRDYVNWLNTGIPALPMLAYLIYWPAHLISDFPNIPYRNGEGALTESAVKSANPRSEAYGGAASRGPRKEYGNRGGMSIATAQSGGSVSPSANQTPDTTQSGTDIFFNMSNTGHALNNSSAFADEYGSGTLVEDRTCRWVNFQAAPPGTISKITLRLNWTHYSQIDNVLPTGAFGGAQTIWKVEYSINGGSSWITLVQRHNQRLNNGSSVLSSESVEAAARSATAAWRKSGQLRTLSAG